VALGRTYSLPPLSFGGASLVLPWLRFHIPLIEPDRQISRIRLSDKTSRCRVQRHLQHLEQLLELIGFPISRSFATYFVCLELRSLPSTRVTRLPRYYEPLRHPRAPSLSLTGLRLVIADHALGLPVLRALSLCTCRRQYPGVADGRNLRSTRPAISTFPIWQSGRPTHRPFRGLLSVHSRCGLHSRAVTNLRHANRRLQPLRYLHDCSDCFRLERLPGGACTHWKTPPCHGARQKRPLNRI
jgi:hypothetical protein